MLARQAVLRAAAANSTRAFSSSASRQAKVAVLGAGGEPASHAPAKIGQLLSVEAFQRLFVPTALLTMRTTDWTSLEDSCTTLAIYSPPANGFLDEARWSA